MDELFRLTVVRPPNAPKSRGVPLDYSLEQSFDVKERLVTRIASALSDTQTVQPILGVASGVPANVKQAARAAAATFEDIYRHSIDLQDEPLRADLLGFADIAHEFVKPIVVTADANALAHDGVQIGPGDFAPLLSDASFQRLAQVGVEDLYGKYTKLVDTFLVQFILPEPDGPSLTSVAELIRPARLALRFLGGTNDLPAVQTVLELEDALDGALILPKPLQLQKSRVHPVGVADLLVVKQKLLRYEAADVARIENVLLGEQREHTSKHSVTTEQELITETDELTESERSVTQNDRTDLKTEVQSSLKETLEATGNVKVGYGADNAAGWHFSASAGVKYNRASEESSKIAAEVMKDVTMKAASKVSQRVKETRRSKSTELLEDLESFKLNNVPGTNHISGVYQYVNKVYLAQVFNYGKRLLFDINVPEPAAYLLDLARDVSKRNSLPTPPPPLRWVEFPPSNPQVENRLIEVEDDEQELLSNGAIVHELAPQDIRPDETFIATPEPFFGVPYTDLIAQFGVPGVTPSPDAYKGAGRSFSRELQKEATVVVLEDQITLPEGYKAFKATVTIGWRHHKEIPESAFVTVRISDSGPFLVADVPGAISAANSTDVVKLGRHLAKEGDDIRWDIFSMDVQEVILTDKLGETRTGTVPVAISALNVDHVTIGIEVSCMRLESWLRKWQLETYARLVQRHAELESAYQTALAKAELARARLGPLGRNPATNREIERTELKRASLNVLSGLSGQALMGRDAIDSFDGAKDSQGDAILVEPPIKEPDLAVASSVGAWTRFFEQAFEWDKIGFTYYPYFWGRMDGWAERIQLTNDDPIFEKFLKAGQARVVIPVRLGWEHAILYFLLWDEPWLGGDMPDVGDALYLPITEEIRDQSDAMGTETPVDSPWEVVVPTQHIKLRKDDALPEWNWRGHENELARLREGNWSWEEIT